MGHYMREGHKLDVKILKKKRTKIIWVRVFGTLTTLKWEYISLFQPRECVYILQEKTTV